MHSTPILQENYENQTYITQNMHVWWWYSLYKRGWWVKQSPLVNKIQFEQSLTCTTRCTKPLSKISNHGLIDTFHTSRMTMIDQMESYQLHVCMMIQHKFKNYINNKNILPTPGALYITVNASYIKWNVGRSSIWQFLQVLPYSGKFWR